MDSQPALVARDLEKTYSGTGEPVTALTGVSLALESGEFVAVMGPSGCGKSTLLHLCGAMDRPTRGSARILELLVDLHRETRVTILLATHADDVAALADRIVRMRDGRIEREERPGDTARELLAKASPG